MTVDVDARMRAASGSLRNASERLTPEVPPRPRVRPVVVAVAVCAVVVLAAGMVALQRDDDRDRVTISETPTVPRLMPGDLPEGLPPPTAFELPMAGSFFGTDSAAVTVYGDPAADDPFAVADLVVVESDVDAFSLVTPEDSDPVTVRGHQGSAGDDVRLGAWVRWDEAPDRHVLVASRTLDRGQLLAIAEGLAAGGGGTVLGSVPTGVPGPLERIGSIPDFPLSSLSLGLAPTTSASAVGHLVGSETDDYDLGLFATTFGGDASDLAVVRWLSRASDEVDVRGHAGWTGLEEVGSTRRTLVWEESPGVVVVVQSTGLDAAELLDAAESLRPAGDEEWDALLSGSATGATGQSLVYLQGEYSAGTWGVVTDMDGQVCGELTPHDVPGDPTEACVGPDVPVATLDDGAGDPVVVYGWLPEGAVDFGMPDPVGADHTRTADDGRRIYAQLVEGSAPTAVVFYDADGQPVTTVEVAP